MKKSTVIHTSGFRKTAIARATLKPGSGKFSINNVSLTKWGNEVNRLKILEPLLLSEGVDKTVDIAVNVEGGGPTSQADAIRLSVAKALNEFTKDKLRETYLSFDRNLIVADVRHRESRKPNCCGKARSKRQKSYR
jgi:small subunit ribosomal protein S9